MPFTVLQLTIENSQKTDSLEEKWKEKRRSFIIDSSMNRNLKENCLQPSNETPNSPQISWNVITVCLKINEESSQDSHCTNRCHLGLIAEIIHFSQLQNTNGESGIRRYSYDMAYREESENFVV